MSRKKWVVARSDKDLACSIAERHNIDPFACVLLVSRGITSDDEIESFFSSEPLLCDPFEIKDMDKAVERINEAIDKREKIAVYGDYDADGITSTALLYQFLEMNGCDVITYIPDRNEEGYGLNMAAIEKLCEKGVKLIITVDNGISAINEAEYISQLGMDLVITDHHKAGDIIPKAVAVVDPHRKDCPSKFKLWAGVGVTFKLICALCGDDNEALDMFSDLVTIGTIGDIVSLTGENRSIVKYGLRMMNGCASAGVEQLKRVAGVSDKSLNATTVAFSIVPRINAIGRMSHGSKALDLLLCEDDVAAANIADVIDMSNTSRQETEKEIFVQAEKQLGENPDMINDRVLIFSGENWHGGVIGIVASRLTQKYGKPCMVITDDGKEAKGSARSIDGFNLFEAISYASDCLTHFGGHTLAAGFGMKSENIPVFRKAIQDYACTVDMPFAKVELDCKIRPEFINADILDTISKLEPFGAGNPQPLFGLFSMTIVSVTSIGSGKHLKINFRRNNTTIQGLLFGVTEKEFAYLPGDIVDLAVRLERNEYMGQVRVSVYIKDIRMSGTDDEIYLKSVRLYEKIKRKDKLTKSQAEFSLPSRQLCADVFRFIKASGGWSWDTDILCYRLGGDGREACKILVATDAFCEMGIFKKEGGKIIVANTTQKVDLDKSEILTYLKSYEID